VPSAKPLKPASSTSSSASSEARAGPTRPRALAGPRCRAGKQAKETDLSSRKLALAAAHCALRLKAQDVVLLDLHKLSPLADFFVICSGQGEVHVKAITDAVREGLLEEMEAKAWHVEGYDTLRWVLLDYVNVVVHVFQERTRDYYSLERFWGDAPREEIADDPSTLPGGRP